MRRPPSRRILWHALFGLAIAMVLLGLSGLGEAGRVAGGLIVIDSALDWSFYWAARDRFQAWRKKQDE